MFPTYQPTSLAHSLIALVFYLLMAGFVVYSFFAIYALLRFGRSKLLAATLSILYVIITLSLYAAAQSNLNNIEF